MRKQGLYGIAHSINLSVLALTKLDFSWLEFIDKLLKNISESKKNIFTSVKNISVTQSLVSHLVFCNFHGDSNLFSY